LQTDAKRHKYTIRANTVHPTVSHSTHKDDMDVDEWGLVYETYFETFPIQRWRGRLAQLHSENHYRLQLA